MSDNDTNMQKKWSDKADEELLLEAVNRLRVAFPDNNKEFYILLYNRLKEANLTRYQVVAKVNHVIDNYLYAKLTIGAVIQAPTTK